MYRIMYNYVYVCMLTLFLRDLAPSLTSCLAVAAYPFIAAQCKGVSPSCVCVYRHVKVNDCFFT